MQQKGLHPQAVPIPRWKRAMQRGTKLCTLHAFCEQGSFTVVGLFWGLCLAVRYYAGYMQTHVGPHRVGSMLPPCLGVRLAVWMLGKAHLRAGL